MVCLGDIRVNTLYKGDKDNDDNNNNNCYCLIIIRVLIYYARVMSCVLSREELIAINKCKENRFIR